MLYKTFMYTKLHKNTGQIFKLMHETLALGQKSGNDPLMKTAPTQESQTQRTEQPQRIEQTDLRPVAVHLSSEARETSRSNRRRDTKKKRIKNNKNNLMRSSQTICLMVILAAPS